MTREQPGPQEPDDPNQTIRHRFPLPGQPPQRGQQGRSARDQQQGESARQQGRPAREQGQSAWQQGPPQAPYTRRLPYTPDMLPDVPVYETKTPRSAWWWVVVVGGLALLVAAIAVAVIIWAANAGAAP